MTNRGKYFYSLVYLIILFAITGCSSNIVIKATADKSVDVQFAMDIGKVLTDTILSISSNDGANKSHVVFSKELVEQIQKSFDSSDFKNVKVTSPTQKEVFIAGTIDALQLQKNVAESSLKASSFIECDSSSLTVILSPATAKKLISSLPSKSREYIDLFMAPVFTGEKMTPEEYKSLLAAVYGDALANELEKSFVKVSLAPPKGTTIKKTLVSGKEYKKSFSNNVVFSIPLLEFLTLRGKVTYSIQWR